MGTYIADAWLRENERLEALARALDPTTIRHMDRLGLAAGASCLEVGAGTGSIAGWMSERVGSAGKVVALDLDTRRLASVATKHANIEVREGDVLDAIFGDSTYDLVHARLVFGHLEDKKRAVARLIGAARPGAWLLLEDADFLWTDVGAQPVHPERYIEPYFRVWRAAVAYMKNRGFDGHWGRHLASLLKDAGLDEVAGEATTAIGDRNLAIAMRMTVERLGPALIESRVVSAEAIAEFDRLMGDPELVFTGSPTFAVWGRRPWGGCKVNAPTNATASDWLVVGARHVWRPYCPMKGAATPLAVARTNGARIILEDGRELVDGIASWWTACHGYNHPHIREAIQAQLARMPHVMFGGLAHEPAYRLATRIARILPGDLDHVFFAESGSVSVEIAMKIAIQYWMNRGERGRTRFVSFRGGYHGDTLAAMTVCDPDEGMHALFAGVMPPQYVVDLPREHDDEKALEDLIVRRGSELAAIIVEPSVQGAGGMLFHHHEVLRRLRRLADRHNLLLIFDEIFTGFGRTGPLFVCLGSGVIPDIVTLSKALTGGTLPLSAAVASSRIFEAFWSDDPRAALMHGPTFMANPLACAAANASLDLFERGTWSDDVARVERGLKTGLDECRQLPHVVSVRTRGAVGVVELDYVPDATRMCARFVEEGVWIRPIGRVVYLTPSFVIADEELEKLTTAVRKVLRSYGD